MEVNNKAGILKRIAGPVVTAVNFDAHMYDVVRVGNEQLMGEVIKIDGENIIIQVYESTTGIRPGEPVTNTGLSLAVELGPGLLTSIYDGIQRPLEVLIQKMGNFISRGVSAPGLDHEKKWEFKPVVKVGDEVKPGQIFGTVQETKSILHKILIPPNAEGGVVKKIEEGSFTVDDIVIELENGEQFPMMQRWPVRVPRPYITKHSPKVPLLTGQRILDGLFPIAKGGTAAIPGPFGSGKTVTQQQLAKWSDAEIVVYIGCGERGNEMTEVLTEFPELKDPKNGNSLMERTILIANTSNMPVAAREASVYTGITIAEYFRDQGYDVALMADSTSRWAEAMREICSRLEEMPGEEGYPAYLSSRLSEFYERAGLVEPLSGGSGSVSVIGAVSPAGGDFSEPVTQNTLRIVKVFWALDATLSRKRHFPAINWLQSYSLYQGQLAEFYDEKVSPEWNKLRGWFMEVLQKEAELNEIVQLVGSDALPEAEQITIEVARMMRELFLQQNGFDPVDTYCNLDKQLDMFKMIRTYADHAYAAQAAGVPPAQIIAVKAKNEMPQIKFTKDYKPVLDAIYKGMEEEFKALRA
ncbi:MAG TPA: V-type ATP synthase subunit A [Methanocorpusculum sp.]|nr:V-type ATP synthase subunit A [Methanocorpusculum sp.]HJJ40190.1 V-type ATP synthase subunit A [Methanocorpusculum sp.]HJJ49579.1 V-type ATP synthase subunit A [Methanocorpusculum sp.]HJJ57664.1 V-type ATP synthase subunit A [Methanocorpusculum sp.]